MEVLITIPLGVIIQLLVFFGLRRFAGFGGKAAALVIALLAVALYMPYALISWPGGDVVAMHLAIYLVVAYGLGLITAHRDQHAEAEGMRFHWAPAVIVAFFVVLILFDGILVVIATQGVPEPVARWLFPEREDKVAVQSAFPGTVAHDFQKKQELYNEYLQQVEVQRARGWQVRKGWIGTAVAGQENRFQVTVHDREGTPIRDAEIEGSFLRPSDTRYDQHFSLQEQDAGRYLGEIFMPVPGHWDLVLRVRRGEDVHEVRAVTEVQVAE